MSLDDDPRRRKNQAGRLGLFKIEIDVGTMDGKPDIEVMILPGELTSPELLSMLAPLMMLKAGQKSLPLIAKGEYELMIEGEMPTADEIIERWANGTAE